MLNSLMSDPGLVLLILFIFMLVCRVPIAISLGLSAAIVSWLFDMGIDMLPYNFFEMRYTVNIKKPATSSPGTIPAANNAGTEASAMPP